MHIAKGKAMAGQNDSYRQDVLERASSPFELDSYIKAVRPGIWLIVVASIVALSSLIIWGVMGRVATTIRDSGVVVEGAVVGFLDKQLAEQVSVGDRATVDGKEASVSEVDAKPMSLREASAYADDDFTLSMLELDDWNYRVVASLQDPPPDGTLVEVVITTDEVAPISFFLKTRAPRGQ